MFPVLPASARYQALAVAVLAAASVGAQWVYLMDLRETGPLATLIDMSRFFTNLTTVLITITFLLVAFSRVRGISAQLLAALTLSSAMTGVVYHVLLADAWNPTGLGVAADIGLHTLLPLAVFAWWLFHAPKTQLIWPDLPAFALWPAVYMAYALGLGTVDGTYPYPFMDPGIAGPERVAATLGILTIALLLGGIAMIGIGRFADR